MIIRSPLKHYRNVQLFRKARRTAGSILAGALVLVLGYFGTVAWLTLGGK